jgi:hypothetical protein
MTGVSLKIFVRYQAAIASKLAPTLGPRFLHETCGH